MFSAEQLLNMRMFLDGCGNYKDMHSIPKVIREIYNNCDTPEQKKAVLVRLFTAILPNSGEDSLILNDSIFRCYDTELENVLLEHIESDILNAAFDEFKYKLTLDDLKHKYTGKVRPLGTLVPQQNTCMIKADNRILNAAELSENILRKLTPYLSPKFDAALIEFDDKFIIPNHPYKRSIFLDTNKYPEELVPAIQRSVAKALHNKIYSSKGFVQFLSFLDQAALLRYVLLSETEVISNKWWQPCYFNLELFDLVDLLPKVEELIAEKHYTTLTLWLENIGPEKIWKTKDPDNIKLNCLSMVRQIQGDRSWEAIVLMGTLLTKSQSAAKELPSDLMPPNLTELFPKYLPEHFLLFLDRVIRALDKLGYFDAYMLAKNSSVLTIIMNYANDFSNHSHRTNALHTANTLLDLWLNRLAIEELVSLANHCFEALNTRLEYNKEQAMTTVFKKLWPVLTEEAKHNFIQRMHEIILNGNSPRLIEQICTEFWPTFRHEQHQIFYATLEPINAIDSNFSFDASDWQKRIKQALKMLNFIQQQTAHEQADQYAEKLDFCKVKLKILTEADNKDHVHDRRGLFDLAARLETAFISVFQRCSQTWQDQFVANNFATLISHVTLNNDFDPASINILAKYFRNAPDKLALYADEVMQSALQVIIEDRRNVPVRTCDFRVSDSLFGLCAEWLILLFPLISTQSQDKVAGAIIDRYLNRNDITLLEDRESPYFAIFSRVITFEQQTKICERISKQQHLTLQEIEIFANLGISRQFLQSFYDQAYFRQYTFSAAGLIEDLLNISIIGSVQNEQKRLKLIE